MSNKEDFIIQNGVLKKYLGNDSDIVIPENVQYIGPSSFRNCHDLISVIMPRTVTIIGFSAFENCINLTSVTMSDKVVNIGQSAFKGCVNLTGIIIPNSVNVIGAFAFYNCSNLESIVMGENIKSIGAGAFDNVASSQTYLPTYVPKEKDTLDQLEAYSKKKEYGKVMRGMMPAFAKVRMKDSEKLAPDYVIRCAIAPYIKQFSGNPKHIGGYKTDFVVAHLDDMADEAASLINMNDLQDALAAQYNFENSIWFLAIGRYSSSKMVSTIISDMRKWSDWNRYARIGRSNIITLRGALMLSDTREAMMYLDKEGLLPHYAAMRRVSADILRDKFIFDFGFDSNGKIEYDLGTRKIVVLLASDLSLQIYDTLTDKYVKSIPKKNVDEDRYSSVSAELSSIKKNLKKAVKDHSDKLFADFINDTQIAVDKWNVRYLGNPILKRFAKLLVWNQNGNNFVLSDNGLIDCAGNEYIINGNYSVGISHPMEMNAKELEEWREYFRKNGLKQPFAQIWEPVIEEFEITSDRYSGVRLSVYKFMNQKKHGIYFYDEDFHNDIGVTLEDCSIEFERTTFNRHEIAKDETFTLGEFHFKKYTRQTNHIVALLDKWSVFEFIGRDEVSRLTDKMLSCFTVAQISEFIDYSTKGNSTNCTARLLDYKNTHFGEVDAFDMFVLE